MKVARSLKPMTREEIITAVESHSKGAWLDITWLFFETVLGAKDRKKIAVTKTWRLRTGINYNHMKSVKERKAKEDAAAGGTLVRRLSSYSHDKDHGFIVTDRLTKTKEFLQVMVANAMELKWETDEKTGKKIRKMHPVGVKRTFYSNGEVITDETLLKTVKAITPIKTKASDEDETFETFVLPIGKIISIQ